MKVCADCGRAFSPVRRADARCQVCAPAAVRRPGYAEQRRAVVRSAVGSGTFDRIEAALRAEGFAIMDPGQVAVCADFIAAILRAAHPEGEPDAAEATTAMRCARYLAIVDCLKRLNPEET